MNGRYLLDTNIVIALFAGDSVVKDSLAKANEVSVPSIVVGELYFGARRSGRVQENLARVDEFVADSVVLGCDTETAHRYGEVKSVLRLT
jgi:tRNA(fMet)-specific endonuclease VapC